MTADLERPVQGLPSQPWRTRIVPPTDGLRSGGWLVTLDDLVIGDCGAHGDPSPGGDVEIGYGLAEPYRGRGYGTELVTALSDWLLAQPGVKRPGQVRGALRAKPSSTPSSRSTRTSAKPSPARCAA